MVTPQERHSLRAGRRKLRTRGMAILTSPRFYENLALIILVGGCISILAGLMESALLLESYLTFPGERDTPGMDTTLRLLVWAVRNTLHGAATAVIGMAVCIGLARYLKEGLGS